MDTDRREGQADPEKLETRLMAGGGPIQGGPAWGQKGAPGPFNLPRDVGARVPLPSSSPDLRELDPGEQCKGGEEGGGG